MHTHKVKQTANNKLIPTVMSATIILGAIGAATGTLAWYTYEKDAELDVGGTTIKADKEIQIGLRCDRPLWKWENGGAGAMAIHYFDDDYTHGEITRVDNVRLNDTDPTEYCIYWIKGNYLTEVLKNFQTYIHSAETELKPITSGRYKTGDIGDGTNVGSWRGFMYQPTAAEGEWETTGFLDGYSDYFYLPLAFRVLENYKVDNQDTYVEDESIFLSKFNATDLTLQQLHKTLDPIDPEEYTIEQKKDLAMDLSKAIRVKVDYPANPTKESNFIFDPNSNEEKHLEVGGVLNLDQNTVYDYDAETKQQIPFGQFDSDVYYKSYKTSQPQTKNIEDCTTFDADNLKGGYEIDFGEGKTVKSTCQSLPSIVNSTLLVDEANGLHALTKTASGANKDRIGFVDLSIYLEGWDKNVINRTAGRDFSVKLEFAIK